MASTTFIDMVGRSNNYFLSGVEKVLVQKRPCTWDQYLPLLYYESIFLMLVMLRPMFHLTIVCKIIKRC